MRRPLLAVAGAVILLASACGSDPGSLSSDDESACQEYYQVINAWSKDYGAEMGAVGQAVAAGDEDRQETAVAVVRELFADMAGDLREQSDGTDDQELAEALGEAADGLDEIAGQIETYDDVTAAPELMSNGQFAEAGQRVSDRCAEE
ncbi:hypothetical protein JQS43_07145 [Natronosporangium hydrolyticum]|uniref:Lipoprotein n=1 Tax=Natronosporangium hydrolyticum TaxID=2811111 RepID=A0A895YE25_9ACTN|nr:hypothetical protein [Natronosporangium hydrolyticum]QSB16074.1 hypothetical protein JQS43_07145 [Natronosporangium hydrolyticum]